MKETQNVEGEGMDRVKEMSWSEYFWIIKRNLVAIELNIFVTVILALVLQQYLQAAWYLVVVGIAMQMYAAARIIGFKYGITSDDYYA